MAVRRRPDRAHADLDVVQGGWRTRTRARTARRFQGGRRRGARRAGSCADRSGRRHVRTSLVRAGARTGAQHEGGEQHSDSNAVRAKASERSSYAECACHPPSVGPRWPLCENARRVVVPSRHVRQQATPPSGAPQHHARHRLGKRRVERPRDARRAGARRPCASPRAPSGACLAAAAFSSGSSAFPCAASAVATAASASCQARAERRVRRRRDRQQPAILARIRAGNLGA
jgi:hypothetical protein